MGVCRYCEFEEDPQYFEVTGTGDDILSSRLWLLMAVFPSESCYNAQEKNRKGCSRAEVLLRNNVNLTHTPGFLLLSLLYLIDTKMNTARCTLFRGLLNLFIIGTEGWFRHCSAWCQSFCLKKMLQRSENYGNLGGSVSSLKCRWNTQSPIWHCDWIELKKWAILFQLNLKVKCRAHLCHCTIFSALSEISYMRWFWTGILQTFK